MAIKKVSNLDTFNNGTSGDKSGGNLHYYVNTNAYDTTPTGRGPVLTANTNGYYMSYFEISQPENPGSSSSTTYFSKKLTYLDLMKNIVLDTKTYINRINNLNNFNINAIVNEDYTFNGNKTFTGNVKCKNLSADNAYLKNLSCTGTVTIDQTINISGSIGVTKDIIAGGNIYSKNIDCQNLTSHGNVSGVNFYTDNIWAKNGYFSQKLSAYYIKSDTDIDVMKNLSVMGNANIHGNARVESNAYVSADLYVGNAIYVDIINALKTGGVITCNNDLNLGNHNITCNMLYGTAQHAYWSDLAEYYKADAVYEPGTLVMFGGDDELTIADRKVNAVVTSKPGFVMNSELQQERYGCAIALIGRVPVKVIGKVRKFDKIVLWKNGIGRRRRWYEFWKKTVGTALFRSDCTSVKLVECFVRVSV